MKSTLNIKVYNVSCNLHNILLISPETSKKRIQEIDSISTGFVYVMSSPSITGNKNEYNSEQIEYFQALKSLKLKNKMLLGFGVSNVINREIGERYFHGTIIGSMFISYLLSGENIKESVNDFAKKISIRYGK